MKKKKLGEKHVCHQCGCRFYDLSRPQPICPKCGVDQSDAQKKSSSHSARPSADDSSPLASVSTSRSRHRKRKGADWDEEEEGYDMDDEDKKEGLEDGLTLLEEDDLSEDDEV